MTTQTSPSDVAQLATQLQNQYVRVSTQPAAPDKKTIPGLPGRATRYTGTIQDYDYVRDKSNPSIRTRDRYLRLRTATGCMQISERTIVSIEKA